MSESGSLLMVQEVEDMETRSKRLRINGKTRTGGTGICASGSATSEEKEVSVLDGNEGSQLDPHLWEELPQELLERVLAKLPVLKLVAFRRVCKFWYTDIIPCAAAHAEASSSRPALLYFDYFRNKRKSKGSPWWMHIHKVNGSLQKFQQKSFPSPRLGENVELIESQEGLLFFAFKERESHMLRDIVVCNPVTAKSKSLGLPHPIKFEREFFGEPQLIVGVVFDKERGDYSIVTVGVDGTGRYIALFYNSSTCCWKNGTSSLPAEFKAGAALRVGGFWSGRSVFCNGNLYWLLKRYLVPGELYAPQYVLEYDVVKDQWRIITVGINPRCPHSLETRMAAYSGAIILWHLNAFSPLVETATRENVDFLKSELFGPNFISRYPQSMNCSCDLELKVDAQINPMQHHMPIYIERVDGLLSIYKKLGYRCSNYLAFNEQNFVYHVLHLTKSSSSSFAIVIHDTIKNSYTELPAVPQERFPREPCPKFRFSSSHVWSFFSLLDFTSIKSNLQVPGLNCNGSRDSCFPAIDL